ncbi:hypothetical protein ACHAXH_005590 [Discostella pseudostelligera]
MVASITMTDVDSTTMTDVNVNKKYYLDALNFYYPVIPSNPSTTSTTNPDTGSCCSVKTDGCSVHSNVCSVTTDYGSVKVIKVMKVSTDSVKELGLEDRHDNDEDDRGGGGDNEDDDKDDRRNSPVTTEKNGIGDDDDEDDVASETHEADDDIKQKQTESKKQTFWDRFHNMINPWNKDEESIGDSLFSGGTASVSQSEDEIRSTDDPDIEQMKEGTGIFPTCTGTVLHSSCQDNEEEMVSVCTAFLDGVYDMLLPVTNHACGPWNNEDEDSLYDSLSSGSTGDFDLEGCECADHKTSLPVNQVLRRAAATKIDLDRLVLSLYCSSCCCHHSKQQSNVFITDDEKQQRSAEDNDSLSSPVDVTDVSSFTKSSPEQPFDDFMLPHFATLPRNIKDDDHSATKDAGKEVPALENFDHPASTSDIFSVQPARSSRKQDAKQVRFASNKDEDRSAIEDAANVPPQQAFDNLSPSSKTPPNQSSINQMSACDQSSLTEVNHCQSEEGDVVTVKVAKKFGSVARASPPDESKQICVTKKVSSFKTSAKQPGDEPMLPYDLTVPSTNNDHSAKDVPVNDMPLETFARQTTHSIQSPAAAKSRLVSLSVGIKRISKKHRLRSMLKSKKKQTPW